MEKSSKNNFEQQWKQKFEGASQLPPADMWNRIEASLDEKSESKPFFLLWGVPAYVVSGIAATLILAISGWFLLSESEGSLVSEQLNQSKTEDVQDVANESVAVIGQSTKKADIIIEPQPYSPIIKNGKVVSAASKSNTTSFKLANSSITLVEFKQTEVWDVASENERRTADYVDATESVSMQKKIISALNKITGRPYDEYPVRYILKRNKLAYVEPVEEVSDPIKLKRNSWIGLISGLSPFKPNFQSGNLNQLAFDNVNAYSSNDANFNIQRNPQGAEGSAGLVDSEKAFAIPIGRPVQQFTNGRAFNLGIQAGKQLTKRLALESGLRYIQGNSPVSTNVYTLNEKTGEINAFVQDYLTQDRTLNNAVVAPAETLSNSYEYLSVPVQLAYGIPLLNKLNVEIIGGVSGDMFLQNTLQSETTDVASLTASNSEYRTLGVSGLGGVRLNYLLDDRWELTLGSAFQQALVSNFESGTSAKLRPQMLGVNYGVNYHF